MVVSNWCICVFKD